MEELKCKYCGKVCKNRNSLAQHEIRCRENPNRIAISPNLAKFRADLKTGKATKKYSNQYDKAKKLGLELPVLSVESREKLRRARLGTKQSEETKLRISKGVRKAVKLNPDTYLPKSTKHVRRIEYNGQTLTGQWELEVAKYLDSQKITWTNKVPGFKYEWQGKEHTYFPDFYLPELDCFLEIKGYQFQPDRDIQKWKAVPNLKVLRRQDILNIRVGKFILDP